jgi:putative NIF3 family GTP cyclohydrolase 1 type 2
MRASEIDSYMRQRAPWVDWSGGRDGFKAGDPNTRVTGIAVAWQSQWPTLRLAAERGCNLFVTHEPTYYYWDEMLEKGPNPFEDETLHAKRRWLESQGMVVYRCHDAWDTFPRIGVRDSWIRALGFEGNVTSPSDGPIKDWYAVQAIPEQTLDDLARTIARRLRSFGQDSVQVVGEGDRRIRSIAVGTGAGTDVVTMASLRDESGRAPDALIVTDDGMLFWKDGHWAIDRGIPLIIVNHATSEDFGMKDLASELAEVFPDVPSHHLMQGCQFRTMSG